METGFPPEPPSSLHVLDTVFLILRRADGLGENMLAAGGEATLVTSAQSGIELCGAQHEKTFRSVVRTVNVTSDMSNDIMTTPLSAVTSTSHTLVFNRRHAHKQLYLFDIQSTFFFLPPPASFLPFAVVAQHTFPCSGRC